MEKEGKFATCFGPKAPSPGLLKIKKGGKFTFILRLMMALLGRNM